jgi:hypothetical protein
MLIDISEKNTASIFWVEEAIYPSEISVEFQRANLECAYTFKMCFLRLYLQGHFIIFMQKRIKEKTNLTHRIIRTSYCYVFLSCQPHNMAAKLLQKDRREKAETRFLSQILENSITDKGRTEDIRKQLKQKRICSMVSKCLQ